MQLNLTNNDESESDILSTESMVIIEILIIDNIINLDISCE